MVFVWNDTKTFGLLANVFVVACKQQLYLFAGTILFAVFVITIQNVIFCVGNVNGAELRFPWIPTDVALCVEEAFGKYIPAEVVLAFDSVGYAGSLNHRVVKLVVDSTAIPNDPAFYATYILPRLTRLFGRAPQFGDGWYNGVRFMWHNGDSWQG